MTAEASEGTTPRRYEERTWERVVCGRWVLEGHQGDGRHLTLTRGSETHETWTEPDLDTVRWRLHNPGAGTDVWAERDGPNIAIRGQLRGEEVQRRIESVEGLWHQAMSLSLGRALEEGLSSLTFWPPRSDTPKAYRLRAKRRGPEDSPASWGADGPLVPVEARLIGLLAPSWKATYWYRPPDRMPVRFERPSGPAGVPAHPRHPGTP